MFNVAFQKIYIQGYFLATAMELHKASIPKTNRGSIGN